MRKQFSKRPALILTSGLLIGASTAFSSWNAFFIILPACLLGLDKTLAPLTLSFALGLVIGPKQEAPPFNGTTVNGFIRCDAVVLDMGSSGAEKQRFLIKAMGQIFILETPASAEVAFGDTLAIQGIVRPLGEFAAKRLQGRGVSGIVQSVDRPKVQHRGPFIWRLAAAAKRSFTLFSTQVLDAQTASFVSAICFGVGSDLRPEVVQALPRHGSDPHHRCGGFARVDHCGKRTGIAFEATDSPLVPTRHIRNISPAILGGGRAASPDRSSSSSDHHPLVGVCIRATTGSAVRSSRSGNLRNSLAPKISPRSRFQLSYVVVAALMLWWRPPSPGASVTSSALVHVKALFTTGLIAWIAALPLTAYHYGAIGIYSPLVNPLIVPVLPAIILSSMLGWLSYGWLPNAAVFLMRLIARPLCGWILFVVEQISKWPLSMISIPEFSAYWIPAYYGVWILVWRPSVKQAR